MSNFPRRYLLPILLLTALLLNACNTSASAHTPERIMPASARAPRTSASPAHPFPQHRSYAPHSIRPNHRTQAQLDDDVRAAYQRWKAYYLLTEPGQTPAGGPIYRVSHGLNDSGRTVSEGQGYGMIIVALMAGYDADAQQIFDGLWYFARQHPSDIDARLMGWQVPADPQSGNDSAFDGDADMAYALLLADAQWGSAGAVAYATEAQTLITAIYQSTIGPDSHLPELGDWVQADDVQHGQYSPRSSDFMPAHFRAFGRASGQFQAWNEVLDATQEIINNMQTDYSPATGLLPDFIVPISATDHWPEPAPPNHLEGPHDGDFDYNAGRVPWRIATDALINGDPTSLAQVQKIANWVVSATQGHPTQIQAGYHLDGTPLPESNYFSTFFAAPMAVATMTTPAHQAFLNDAYDAVVNQHQDYYEDTVTLLSLLLMTGNYWDPTLPDYPTNNYPRLGMWWPNPWEQPLTDIARYDWVILSDYEKEFVTPLKTINPQLTLLNATNACELSWNADEETASIPAQWFLTQVGTTLTQAVDATSTTLHIAETRVDSGEENLALFEVGDTALIDGESVRITAVNESAKTLTVERGFVRPASAHDAGTRIAAHITFWPESWVLNLSEMAPRAQIGGTGPDNWASYNAQAGAALLTGVDWDGLLIDRADPDQSWLVDGGYARSIDPNQSNTLPASYSAFDASWNQGLRRYMTELRALIGDTILFANLAMPNYDLLNGNNYEGYPNETYPWHQLVFGPRQNGSYFDWMQQGQKPNLSMIETYEIDGYHENNPCDDTNFSPNYQKMRYGLTTNLLNNGYFAYEIGTNGHGSLCLLWFDEYDNAGQGRGYLGQPLGPAYHAANIQLGPNLLASAQFETQDDLDNWDLWADDGYAASLSLESNDTAQGNAAARITITQAAGTDWRIAFSFEPVSLSQGQDYTISFWARADAPRALSVWAQKNAAPWDNYLTLDDPFQLSSQWQHFEIPLNAQGSDTQAGFYFGLGQTTGTVWLDDVQLRAGNTDVWRRDFEGGVALINATHSAQTIDLGGEYRKISGQQVPSINDGSVVTQVTLPAHDGIILLRPAEASLYLPLITISPSGDDAIQLSWTHDPAYTRYQVWQGNAPYFEPVGTPQVVETPPWQFIEDDARGNPWQNRYYQIVGLLPNGRSRSNRVGEFDFALSK